MVVITYTKQEEKETRSFMKKAKSLTENLKGMKK